MSNICYLRNIVFATYNDVETCNVDDDDRIHYVVTIRRAFFISLPPKIGMPYQPNSWVATGLEFSRIGRGS
jgi:hypothetical protein